MLTKISLIVALCAHVSTAQIQSTLSKLQAQNPGSKITVRLDQKSSCDKDGNVLEKSKKSKFETTASAKN